MLTLTRKANEAILVYVNGELIKIIVSKISGNKVLLAIEADRSIRIMRAELAPKALPQKEENDAVPSSRSDIE